MSGMFAMQRANGDWFAFDDHGRFRVPVFHSSREAMVARARHQGMLLFKPVVLDERVLKEIAPADGGSDVYFWLVDNPSADSNRGHLIEHAQLALLTHEAAGQPQG